MSEAARSRRDDPRYEPQMAAPGHADPLAELARLVGQDDPFRGVFRPTAAPAPVEHQADDHAPRYLRDAPYSAEAAPQHDDAGYDPHPVDHGYDPAHAHPDERPYDHADDVYDDHYDAAEANAHHGEEAFADQHLSAGAAAAAMIPDVWARSNDGDGAPSLDHAGDRAGVGADRRSSARRPLAVLAAVLVLTGGGLAASFLVKSPSTSGVAAAGSGRGAPTIMASTSPTKVKIEDAGATAPEDQDAALLNKNGNVSSGPVKIVSSQEQPVDLGQLPKTSDLADGARPLPPAAPSPFPEPKKVKTFVVHPDGTMLSSDGAALPGSADVSGATMPKGGAQLDAIAALAAQPDAAGTSPARAARQPTSPAVRSASAKPNDTAGAPGGYGVQLASSTVEAEANAAFAKLKKKYPSQLGSLTASVHKAETGDKPVYRVRVGSMSQDEAKALCSQLQGAGGTCFVVHN